MTHKSEKGDSEELKSKNLPGGACRETSLRVVDYGQSPIFPQGQQNERNASARENHLTREKATCGAERACRLFSRGVIFRKNGRLLVVYQSRESVSIYFRSTPGVLLRRREIDLDLTQRSNFFNEPRLRKVKLMISSTGDIYVVVQFYPWFNFYFPLFLGMVTYDNEFETKENKN